MTRTTDLPAIALVACVGLAFALPARAQFASTVTGWDRGGETNEYEDPTAVLGSPDRMTADWPSGTAPVTIFNPPWGTEENGWGYDQLFSFGPGGTIEVQFDEPVVDDSLNPFGIDLIVFGNAGFIAADWPPTTITDPATLFGAEDGTIEVSQDGQTWVTVSPPYADALFSTTGWSDATHTAASDFLRPVDPSLTLSDFDGLTEAEALALYAGSGGGTGVDLAGTGLSWIRYVRVTNANTDPLWNVEIDAFADVAAVPERGGLLLAGVVLALGLRRKRK